MSGRGRAADSRCLLLTCDEDLREREERNILREKIMEEALRSIAEKPPTWFSEEVSKRAQENIKERAQKNLERVSKSKSLHSKKYKLLCKKCDTLICTSDDIAMTCIGPQYLCVCEEIWERSRQYPYSQARAKAEENFQLKGFGTVIFNKYASS
ncbi:unnamed protein product [Gongylonema pulchrum]|uniref:RLR CTR domain-containing protein n=1 Tax=Gongylonema pulchrum TaxID=637853 RepID=A0A183D528_9BILA|nr:unnamed protein product [Gongylonema pulchrum]